MDHKYQGFIGRMHYLAWIAMSRILAKPLVIVVLLAIPWFYCTYQIYLGSGLIEQVVESHLMEIIFNSTLSLSGIFLAVIGILISIYWSGQATGGTKRAIKLLLFAVTALLVLSTFSCMMAFAYLAFQSKYLVFYILSSFFSIIYLIAICSIALVIVSIK